MKLTPALFALSLAVPATAQVTIDSHGIRTGGTTIDATGVHTPGGSIDRTGVHRGGAGVPRGASARTINGNNLSQRVDCSGGTLTVNGNHNDLMVSNCPAITVAGNHNTVSARFLSPGAITVAGNYDQLTYATAPGVAVSVNNIGTRSTVSRR